MSPWYRRLPQNDNRLSACKRVYMARHQPKYMQLVISDGRWLMESFSSAVLHEGASSNSVKQIRPVYPNE